MTEAELPNSLPRQAAEGLQGAIDACGWGAEAVVRSEYRRFVEEAAERNKRNAELQMGTDGRP
jgi:hypothetical protein